MKRTATLVAGLLLVTGTVFAGTLDLSGTSIKLRNTLLDSTTKAVFNDDSNGDTDAVIQAKFNIDDSTSATFKYETDSDSDDSMGVTLKKTYKDVEVQWAGTYETKAGTTKLVEDHGTADTYGKWNKSKDLSVAFYPFNMGLNNGATFDNGDSFTQIPGLVVNYKTAYVGLGLESIEGLSVDSNGDIVKDKAVSVTAVKAGYKFAQGPLTLNAKYSGVFFDQDKAKGLELQNSLLDAAYKDKVLSVVGTGGRLGSVTNDITLDATYKVSSALVLDGTLGYNTIAKETVYVGADAKEVKGGVGISAKATYTMGAIVPYAKVQYSQDGYLANGDMRDLNKLGTQTDGLTKLVVGSDYKLNDKVTANLEGVYKTAGKEIYTDKDGKAVKNAMSLAASITVGM